MKTLLLLGVCFLLTVPVLGQGQAQVFKGANTILVQTSDSANTALTKMARLFVQQGFTIDKLDQSLGYLTTTGKTYGQISPAVFTYKVVAQPSASGTVLVVTGEYIVQAGLRSITSPMHWYKGNLTQDKQCFLHAQEVANAYSGASVSYAIR